MSGVQCENFIGNAWKKDLCLNCFKSKEEHATRNGHWTSAPARIPDPPKEGILKGMKSIKHQAPKGNKVIFLNTECEVIGFGGDDVYYSDEEDYSEVSANDRTAEDDDDVDSEEDRAFQKLTKTNTDYNSVPENLQEPKEGETKKIIEPLKLGKQVFDEKGNKKTLLVSVTPFGDQTTVKNRINVNGLCSSLVVKETTANGARSDVDGPKSENSVVSEKEKTETSVNGESEETCVNAVGIAQISNEDIFGKQGNDKSLKRSQPLDKNCRVRLSKENERSGESTTKEEKEKIKTSEKVNNIIEKAKVKANQFPVITEKFRTKDLTNLPGKKAAENNKTVLLDMHTIRENGDVKRQNEINEEKTRKGGLASPEMRDEFLSSLVKMTPPDVDVPDEDNSDKVENGVGVELSKGKTESTFKAARDKAETLLDRSKLVPNVSSLYRHHLRNLEGNKSEALANGIVDSKSLTPNMKWAFSENDKIGAGRKEGQKEIVPKGSEEDKELPKEEKFKKTSFDSFENFERIIKGEEITLFSAEETREAENKDPEKEEQVPEISRESAGEPDGRADSDDLSEPPALPLKPPPPLADSRNSFFADLSPGGEGMKSVLEKPKVPAKPMIIHSKKINFQSPIHPSRPKSPSMEKFLDVSQSPQVKGHASLQESLSSDSGKNQKRPAPKPPSPREEPSERYVADVAEVESDDSASKPPEVEEKTMKRMSRSTENLLEFISGQEEKEQLSAKGVEKVSVPEPVPRRSLSLSQDSLVSGEPGDAQSKKKPSRGRFFLRKLLHLGKPKDSGAKDLTFRQKSLLPPTPKPKLEIIHPSDLNGSRVEVVPPARSSKSRRSSSSASSSSGEQRESDVPSDSSTSHSVSSSGNDSQSTIERAKKPPPPPRAHSLDAWTAKPARPPPPKSVDLLRQTDSSWPSSAVVAAAVAPADPKSDSLYVNLGEARSGLAPNKPMRTGSLREANMENSRRLVAIVSQPEDSDYESFVVAPATPSHPSEDNLYECVQVSPHRSSLPECDSSLTEAANANHAKEKKSPSARNNGHRRSEGNVDFNCDYFKMKFSRSVSLPYCASETESEIYSPYSFYGSELGEEDYESSASNQSLRMSRLKLKKGRSIVHKNLEDNYGAVIVANHEALAQVAEQMRQGPVPPPALRALSSALNLRWSDFAIAKDATGVVVERRVFYPALWGAHGVTLSLAAEQGVNSSFHAKGPFNLNPLTELNDLVPASYLPQLKKDESELVQASVSVLTRLQIETVESYGKTMRCSFLNDESKREVNFVLLQIVNAFKTLQAQGIEEAPKNLTNLVVCREERDPHPRICITHSFERSEEEASGSSLCQCVTHALMDILPPTDLTPLISSVLRKEKAVSLSQAKCILEFTLWGPADISFGNSSRERECALQRWLDLERATVLHGLVRTRAELTVFEEWQLLFLVRTNAKMMAEASMLLESGLNC